MRRSVEGRWLRIYTIASLIHSTAWGLYFAFTRFYIVTKLGGGYTALLFLTGAEWGLPALSIVWGALADKYGRRKFVMLGASGALAFAIAAQIREPMLFVAILSYASFAWGLAWPSVLAPVLTPTESVGRRYSVFMVGSTLGWSLGSSAMGFLYNLAGPRGVLFMAALLYACAYALYTAFFPREYERSERAGASFAEFRKLAVLMLMLLIAIALATFGAELGFNLMAVKLEHELSMVLGNACEDVKAVLYGFLYGGITTLMGVPARIVAGRIADRWSPLRLFIAVDLGYVAYIAGLVLSHGIVTIILWQIPLYPFFDVSVYASTSRYAPPELKASVAGVTLAAQSLGGLAVAFAGPLSDILGPDIAATIACIALLLSAITATVFSIERAARDRG